MQNYRLAREFDSMKDWTVEKLLAFEEEVKAMFLSGEVRGPVHLCGGNEAELIEIFKDIDPKDWVFSTWRNHYHALLHNVPPEYVMQEIMAGKSMMMHSNHHRFLTSAIVGGILPIAAGVALGLKMRGCTEKVWVFVGDMTARTGLFNEFLQYVEGHGLPVKIVIEDNGLSTNTPTKEVWGNTDGVNAMSRKYSYERTVPHVGVGEWVTFA